MKEMAEFHRALSHPTRIAIIKVLGERELVSFTEIKKSLNIGDAKLYYHLINLKKLVIQNSDLKYFLTEQGKQAFQILFLDEKEKIISLNKEDKKGLVGNIYHYLNIFLLPKWLILSLFNSPLRNAVEVSLAILIGSWIASISGLRITLLLINYDPGRSQILLLTEFIVSWLLIYGLTLIVSSILNGKGNNFNLFIGVTFSRIPIIVFSLFWMLDRTFIWGIAFYYKGILIKIFMLFFQAWSLSLLTLAISLSKKFSLEKAALITLIITYLNLAYNLTTQKF